MIMWKISSWGAEIKQIEIERKTNHYVIYHVTYGGCSCEYRERIDGVFFDTFEQARSALIAKYEARIAYNENQLEANKRYLNIAIELEPQVDK